MKGELFVSRWVKPWDAYHIADTEWTKECVVIGVVANRYLRWQEIWLAWETKLVLHRLLKDLH